MLPRNKRMRNASPPSVPKFVRTMVDQLSRAFDRVSLVDLSEGRVPSDPRTFLSVLTSQPSSYQF
jgi:hypothetical protein